MSSNGTAPAPSLVESVAQAATTKEQQSATRLRAIRGAWEAGLTDMSAVAIAPPWIVGRGEEGWVAPGELTIVSGPGGRGKSRLVMQMICAALAGEDFAGFGTRKVPMVWLDYDQGDYPLRRIVHAAGADRAFSDVEYRILDAQLSLADAAVLAHITTELKARGSEGLLVIDALASSTPGVPENENEARSLLVRAIRDVAIQTGWGIVLLAHTGWDGKHIRGGSAQLDSCGVLLNMLDDSADTTGPRRCLSVKPPYGKVRIGATPEDRWMEMNSRGILEPAPSRAELQAREDVVSMRVILEEPLTATALREALGGKDLVGPRRAVENARERGDVSVHPEDVSKARPRLIWTGPEASF